MATQSQPRRGHSEHFAAFTTFGTGNPAPDLARVLKDVQMPPDNLLGMVVTRATLSIHWTSHVLPHLRRLLNRQAYFPLLVIELTFDHFPLHS